MVLKWLHLTWFIISAALAAGALYVGQEWGRESCENKNNKAQIETSDRIRKKQNEIRRNIPDVPSDIIERLRKNTRDW